MKHTKQPYKLSKRNVFSIRLINISSILEWLHYKNKRNEYLDAELGMRISIHWKNSASSISTRRYVASYSISK